MVNTPTYLEIASFIFIVIAYITFFVKNKNIEYFPIYLGWSFLLWRPSTLPVMVIDIVINRSFKNTRVYLAQELLFFITLVIISALSFN
jgi:hypothetical protein